MLHCPANHTVKQLSTRDTSDARENWLGAAQQAGTTILNTNPNLLIFVESTGFATDGFPSPLQLPGYPGHVVDSVHYYPGDSQTSWLPVVGTTPVWVGEFGMTVSCVDNPVGSCGKDQNSSFIASFIAFVNSQAPGQVGWSWWPVNGTHSDGGIEASSTYYDEETYGL